MAAKESRAGAVSGPSAGEPGARCISRFSTGRAGTATRVRRPPLSRAVPTTARVLVPWAAQVRAQGGHGHRSADPRSSPPARPSPSFHGAVGSRWGSVAPQARLAKASGRAPAASTDSPATRRGGLTAPLVLSQGAQKTGHRWASAARRPGGLRHDRGAGTGPGQPPCVREEVVAVGGRGHPSTHTGSLQVAMLQPVSYQVPSPVADTEKDDSHQEAIC